METISVFVNKSGSFDHETQDCSVHVAGGLSHVLPLQHPIKSSEQQSEADPMVAEIRQGVEALSAKVREDGLVRLTFSCPAEMRLKAGSIAIAICKLNSVPPGTNVDIYVGDNKKPFVYVHGSLSSRIEFSAQPTTLSLMNVLSALILKKPGDTFCDGYDFTFIMTPGCGYRAKDIFHDSHAYRESTIDERFAAWCVARILNFWGRRCTRRLKYLQT